MPEGARVDDLGDPVMEPRCFRRLMDLVGDALERPPAQREAFLQEACGEEPHLLAEACDLVAMAERTSLDVVTELLDARVRRAAAAFQATTGGNDGGRLPETVGPYRILELLGEGGMGVVYRAVDNGEIRREVALKVIRAGLGTPEAHARFQAERQALARMTHPAIAGIYDAGTTNSGVPFFAMELVEGEPITAWCDRHRLDLEARVTLLTQVCRGVHHAHQKGVIHRDLKPSNILVSETDDRPRPRVIDFGIAKTLEASADAGETLTSVGSVMGTLEYMSPEQAAGDAARVDTRSDVYALGVILYQLITGELPFEPAALRNAGPLEAQRILRETDPTPPGQRYRTTPERVAIARCRNASPVELDRWLRGPMEWIILRALERDPERRYPSANDLAVDLDRLLGRQPVDAAPRSPRYRARLFISRHRVGVAATAAMLAAVATGTVLAASGYRQARAESLRAQTVSGFLTDMLASVRPDQLGREVLVTDVLDDASARLEEGAFSGDVATESEILRVLAISFESLGRYPEALPLFRRSLELRRASFGPDDPRTFEALFALGTHLWRRGDLEEALEIRRELVLMTAPRAEQEPGVHAESLSNLANTLADLGRFEEAVPHYQEALAIGRNLPPEQAEDLARFLNTSGTVLMDLERDAEAEALFRESLAIRETTIGRGSVNYTGTLANLAASMDARPETLEESVALFEQVLAHADSLWGPDHPRTGDQLSSYFRPLLNLGRLDEAESAARRALAIRLATVGEGHWRTAMERQKVAEVLLARGEPGQALPLLHVAWDGLMKTQDSGSGWARGLAATLARAHQAAGDETQAAEWAARAGEG
jgi:eukaryotic-like serine/threonine-protein kinase